MKANEIKKKIESLSGHSFNYTISKQNKHSRPYRILLGALESKKKGILKKLVSDAQTRFDCKKRYEYYITNTKAEVTVVESMLQKLI